jgi:GH35 family endo-1,4-beta-xylanase
MAAGLALPALAEPTPVPVPEELLAGADARIEKHRKADGLLVVRDGRGSPVPGARVRVEQVRHDFLFGCNFYMFGKLGEAGLEESYRQQYAALFNYATLGFYWTSFEPKQGHPDYAPNERAAAWCAERQIACKGHPLVWDHPASSPKWLPNVLLAVGELASDRVTDIVSHYRGHIDIWDVVNEPTHLGDPAFRKKAATHMGQYGAGIGPHAYTTEYLKVARAANPSATLLVNDYQIETAYYRILESLKQDGKLLFDAVGLQSHLHDSPWPLPKVWDICETYARLGKPVHFTETTVISGPRLGPGEHFGPTTPALEEAQARYVESFYKLLFSHPAVQAITWWDFSDRGAWQGAAAGFLRQDMSPKPVYDRLKQLIKTQWWTKMEAVADEKGEVPLRAFTGWHRVTATLPDGRAGSRVMPWKRGETNRCEVVVRAT